MRARYDSVDGSDAIDGAESDGTQLASRTASVTEIVYVAPAIAADPSPSQEDTFDAANNEIIDGGALSGTAYDFGGAITFSSGIVSIADVLKYNSPLVATATPENDTLLGTAGDDVIDGGDGADVIYGYAGSDLLLGGAGDDLILGGLGNDHLEGGDGDDDLSAGEGDDVVFGGAGRDSILGGNGLDHLYGGDGNDWVQGGDGLDYADGGAGDDQVIGDFGNDMLWGGAGNDDVDGGDGYDTLFGGDGNDTLHGRNHADTLFGGAGDDALYGDGLYGSHIYGPSEPYSIEGADTLYGEDGNDRLFGLGGDDHLYGGEGGDILNGGDGNDVIEGGAGSDLMRGEAGRDVFVFSERPYQGYYYSEHDTIVDFNGSPFSGDVIDLRQMFDKYTNFTGTTADQAWAQGYLYLVEQDGNTTVYIDPNGNAPDEPTYYGQHYDIAVVTLEGVSRDHISASGGSFYGYVNNFWV